MSTLTPVACPKCGASRWHVTFSEQLDTTVEYTMTTPGAVDGPEETMREGESGFEFACAECGCSVEADKDGYEDEALREQARRVYLDRDGKIDWQSEPGG